MSTLPIPLSPPLSFLSTLLPLFFLQELETGLNRVPRTHYFSARSPQSLSFSAPLPPLPAPFTWELSALSSPRRDVGSGRGGGQNLQTGACGPAPAMVPRLLNKQTGQKKFLHPCAAGKSLLWSLVLFLYSKVDPGQAGAAGLSLRDQGRLQGWGRARTILGLGGK